MKSAEIRVSFGHLLLSSLPIPPNHMIQSPLTQHLVHWQACGFCMTGIGMCFKPVVCVFNSEAMTSDFSLAYALLLPTHAPIEMETPT